jgi:hypothetical protein
MGITITPDFNEAQEQDQIPAGVYNARVNGVEQKTSKAGAAYLSWKLVIYGAEGEYARQNNRPVFLTTMTSGKGAGILKSFIKATIGTVGASFNTDDLLGKELQITLVSRNKPDGTPGWPEVKAMKAIQH